MVFMVSRDLFDYAAGRGLNVQRAAGALENLYVEVLGRSVR
jgi:hypothetical protein